MEKILIISARSYGDAIIANYLINKLSKNYDITVFTKKEFRDMYDDMPVNVVYSRFPMGTNSTINIYDLCKKIFKLRNLKFDYAIDLIGDFRERSILYAISPRCLMSIERECGHPFNRLIRSGLETLIDPVVIPKDIVNFYDQIDVVVRRFNYNTEVKKTLKKNNGNLIGIHPFASQKCRMWTWENWNALVRKLVTLGYEVVIFGSSNQKKDIESNVITDAMINISCGTIDVFFETLKKCRCIVCLDSFAYHAAYYLNVPSVMINGGNQYQIWKTPLSAVLHSDDICPHWPCYNKPRCKENICITSIDAETVFEKIKQLLTLY